MPRIGTKDSPEQKLLGCDSGICAADVVRSASPVSYVDPSDPPFLLIHGKDDTTVPVAQSRELETALHAAGVPVDSIYIEGSEHSFLGKTPEQTRANSLRAVNATFDFFHARLGVPRK